MTVLNISVGLFLIFLVLKLGEIGAFATWSWWAVFSPLGIGFFVWLVLVTIYIWAVHRR